jgi:hypothetical protein
MFGSFLLQIAMFFKRVCSIKVSNCRVGVFLQKIVSTYNQHSQKSQNSNGDLNTELLSTRPIEVQYSNALVFRCPVHSYRLFLFSMVFEWLKQDDFKKCFNYLKTRLICSVFEWFKTRRLPSIVGQFILSSYQMVRTRTFSDHDSTFWCTYILILKKQLS